MAVPKKKTSKSKRDMRSAGKGLVKKAHIRFDEKGEPVMSHMKIFKRERKPKENKEGGEAAAQ